MNLSFPRALLLGVGLPALPFLPSNALEVWTGPPITFSQPGPDFSLAENQDRITDKVWLSRAKTRGLFNARTESGYGPGSPADTEWAFGKLADRATLSFGSWENWNGRFPPAMAGKEAVMHLISEDIYLAVTFRSWGRQTAGGFAYTRSTPAPKPEPLVLDPPVLTSPDAATLRFMVPAGARLEVAVALDGAWESVTGAGEVEVPISGPARFFRLRRP